MFPKHTIFAIPFVDILKVKDTSKECVATTPRSLYAKACVEEYNLVKKRYKKKPYHMCKVYFKNSHPIASSPTFKENRVMNDNPLEVNIAKGEDIITAVVSKINLVTNVSKCVIESSATKNISANISVFTSYTSVWDGEEYVYLNDSRTTHVLGKGKVLLKLTFGKTLTSSIVLHVPSIIVNLIFVALLEKVTVKLSFESDKIVMTKKNNAFMGKGYCDQCLFVLNIYEIINESSSSASMFDSYDV